MRRTAPVIVFALALGSACHSPRPTAHAPASDTLANEPLAPAPINATCPRSGLPVADDSLTEYRGYVVGFCNQHCRDDFVAHVDQRPNDRDFFDAAIAHADTSR